MDNHAEFLNFCNTHQDHIECEALTQAITDITDHVEAEGGEIDLQIKPTKKWLSPSKKSTKFNYQLHENRLENIPSTYALVRNHASGETKIIKGGSTAARRLFKTHKQSGMLPKPRPIKQAPAQQQKVAAKADRIFNSLAKCTATFNNFDKESGKESPYLQSKKLNTITCDDIRHGLNPLNKLPVTICRVKDLDDEASYQIIFYSIKKQKYEKYNVTGTSPNKMVYRTQNIKDFLIRPIWFFAEGIGDARSIELATGMPVVGILGAGAVNTVIGEYLKKAQELGINAPTHTVLFTQADEAGVKSAILAADNYNTQLIDPWFAQCGDPEPLDWSDIFQKYTGEAIKYAVRSQLLNPAKEPNDVKREKKFTGDLFTPGENYYEYSGATQKQLKEKALYYLSGAWGTGKTTAVKTMLQDPQIQDSRIIVISPLTSLAEAHGANLPSMTSYKKLGADGWTRNKRVSTTINSLVKLSLERAQRHEFGFTPIPRFEIIFIDELHQVLESMFTGEHVQNRRIVIDTFEQIVRAADLIIIGCTSATASDLNYMKKLRPNHSKFKEIKHTKQPGKGIQVIKYYNEIEAENVMHDYLRKGTRLNIPITAIERAKKTFHALQDMFPEKKGLLVTSETSRSDEVMDFLKGLHDPNINSTTYDYVINTGAWMTGVDMPKGTFNLTISFLSGNVCSSKAATQHVSRLREPERIIYHIQNPSQSNSPNSIIKSKFGAIRKEDETRLALLNERSYAAQYLHTESDGRPVIDAGTREWCENYIEMRGRDTINFEQNLINLLKEKGGYSYTEGDADVLFPEEAPERKAHKRKYYCDQIQKLTQAPQITEKIYNSLKKDRGKLGKLLQAQKERFELDKVFGTNLGSRITVNNKTISEEEYLKKYYYLNIKKVITEKKIQQAKLTCLTDIEAANHLEKDWQEKELPMSSPIGIKRKVARLTLDTIGVTCNGIFGGEAKEYSADSPEVLELIATLKKEYGHYSGAKLPSWIKTTKKWTVITKEQINNNQVPKLVAALTEEAPGVPKEWTHAVTRINVTRLRKINKKRIDDGDTERLTMQKVQEQGLQFLEVKKQEDDPVGFIGRQLKELGLKHTSIHCDNGDRRYMIKNVFINIMNKIMKQREQPSVLNFTEEEWVTLENQIQAELTDEKPILPTPHDLRRILKVDWHDEKEAQLPPPTAGQIKYLLKVPLRNISKEIQVMTAELKSKTHLKEEKKNGTDEVRNPTETDTKYMSIYRERGDIWCPLEQNLNKNDGDSPKAPVSQDDPAPTFLQSSSFASFNKDNNEHLILDG